jgi:hypothetical protein
LAIGGCCGAAAGLRAHGGPPGRGPPRGTQRSGGGASAGWPRWGSVAARVVGDAEQRRHHPGAGNGRKGGRRLWYGRLRGHRRDLPTWIVLTALMLPLCRRHIVNVQVTRRVISTP